MARFEQSRRRMSQVKNQQGARAENLLANRRLRPGYLPTITSDDLMMAVTLSPALRSRSSAASFVIDDVT
jgi:hypothetical protein